MGRRKSNSSKIRTIHSENTLTGREVSNPPRFSPVSYGSGTIRLPKTSPQNQWLQRQAPDSVGGAQTQTEISFHSVRHEGCKRLLVHGRAFKAGSVQEGLKICGIKSYRGAGYVRSVN